jgi:pyruvate dehydrogenase E1 component alpha subunit
MACANVSDRAPGYGIPAEIVDGNDVFAVYHAARRAAEHARSGNGPFLIECKTFRMTGHSAHDAASYVPGELFEQWAARDPIARLERKIIAEDWAAREELDHLHDRIRQELDEAVEWAENSPYPDPSSLLDNVYERS